MPRFEKVLCAGGDGKQLKDRLIAATLMRNKELQSLHDNSHALSVGELLIDSRHRR
jgi:hypothetical protein